VARRRSVTALKCCAPKDLDDDEHGSAGQFVGGPGGGGGGAAATCAVYHLRDSPFCHAHSYLDPKSRPLPAPGVTELEVALNRAVEGCLDHAKQLPLSAAVEGAAVRARLPLALQASLTGWSSKVMGLHKERARDVAQALSSGHKLGVAGLRDGVLSLARLFIHVFL
jgi:hypothetical protein